MALAEFMSFGRSSLVTMTLVFLLMTCCWACLVGATDGILDDEYNHLQPCSINPLCRCSRAGPELGLVFCEDIPLANVPASLNNTKAFALNMRRNGLRRIEEHVFHGTGLWRIEIRSNQIASMSEYTFAGVERSLSELFMPYNRFQKVPYEALEKLQKLKVLDLSGNQISELHSNDFQGLTETLQYLSLADNSISVFQLEAIAGLQRLEKLDLRANNIVTLPAPTSGGPNKLMHLNLADNSLDRIPFAFLEKIRALQTINLSNNRIQSTFDVFYQGKLTLDTVLLENNTITKLAPVAFQNFRFMNRTSLNGNPIVTISENAFKDVKIRELSITNGYIRDIEKKAFRGLESTLERLDLSMNNISYFPDKVFENFDSLKTLLLNDNKLSFNPKETLSGFRYTLHTLNLVGEKMGRIPHSELHDMRNLRSIGLTSMDDNKISLEDFEGFGPALESLSLSKNNLQAIKNNAFRHIAGLKTLDLTENRIYTIERDAFTDIGNSLTYLNMVNGLALSSLPSEAFKKLTALRTIDAGFNKLSSLSADLFHASSELRWVNFQDNIITKIPSQFFHNDYVPYVEYASFSFNQIDQIDSQTFVDNAKLRILNLDDNKINRINKGAFQNMKCLEAIHLEGNKIENIQPEAFQNLPKLELLNMAYNKLSKLSFEWLDQVGTVSALRLDMSHNNIQRLEGNGTGNFATYASIRILDLSYNNISSISRNFFGPIRSSLTHLIMRHNDLREVSRNVYSDMQHLYWLELSENQIQTIDSEAFANAKSLQYLLIDNNDISELYQDMFGRSASLRMLNCSNNRIRFLPDSLFKDTILEILDISYNQISKIPDGCLFRIASTLRHFHASHNEIAVVSAEQFKSLNNLVSLDLSYNFLTSLTDNTFGSLYRLAYLDLSGNPLKSLPDRLLDNMRHSLVQLNLVDIGMESLSEFYAPDLLFYNVSHNKIDAIPSDFFNRFTSLREFDISFNEMINFQESLWSQAFKLRKLNLEGNHITTFHNSSFVSLKGLDYLNIQQLPLNHMEPGCLIPMQGSLRYLAMSTYEKLGRNFNVTRLVEQNYALRHLDLEVLWDKLDTQLRGDVPYRLSNLTLRGWKLKTIDERALDDFKNNHFMLTMRNTSVESLTRKFFENLGHVRFLQLDLRHNRLQSVGEPSNTIYPGTPGTTFLTHIFMSDNDWKCDCTTGWVEFWMRKWRQIICREKCYNYGSNYNYQYTIRDLRHAECRNRNNKSMVDAVKSDLECGWSSSPSVSNNWKQWALVIMIGMTLLQQLNSFAI